MISRSFIYVMLAMCLLCACNENGRESVDGGDNPLSEWTLPVMVAQAGEGTVQWNGFTEETVLLLVSPDGSEYRLEITVLTDSGVNFRVPSDVPEGTYMMVMEQDGRTEMGQIRITGRSLPVSDVRMPSEAVAGAVVSIAGIGFEDGCSIVLAGSAGEEHVLGTTLSYDGVCVTVPDDVSEGTYDVYLLQEGGRWLISDSFRVTSASVARRCTSIRYLAPYVGEAEIMLAWDISDDILTLSEYLVQEGVPELNAYDSYVRRDEGYYALEHDGFESSNDMEMLYSRDQDGNVVSSDVLIYGDDRTTAFTWTYDSSGLLVDISSPRMSFRTLSYEEGRITAFHQTSFEYAPDGPVNSVYAPDVIWAYMSLMDRNDPFVYLPYLLGWYSTASDRLPSKILKPSPSGFGVLSCSLEYEFDDDGYVVSMNWSEGSERHRIEFIYSDMI